MKTFLKMENDKIYDVIVVGAGPAGISAAIYSIRKGLKVGIIADAVGGQVTTTNGIENIIGTISTTGYDFTMALEGHAKEYEIPFYQGHLVSEIVLEDDLKVLKTDDKKFKTKAVIIASGAKHKTIGVKGESEFAGKGVHYCATCDGPFYRNLDVVIVGGGNSGVEAAIDLSSIAKSVKLVEFMPELKADKLLQEKLKEKENVLVYTNARLEEIKGENFVTSLTYENRETKEIKELKIDGVFIEIGLEANTKVFSNLLEMNKYGEILINKKNETNIKGIFAAGDCTDVLYKQIVISIGEGAKAALSAFEYIIKN